MNDIRPGGGAAPRRPLHFFWLADNSGSMQGSKVEALNTAIREAIPPLVDVARENPTAEMLVRAITFGDEVRWHIPKPTPIDELVWPEVRASGYTRMGGALSLLTEALHVLPNRALRPAVVLISDGQPTDDFGMALRAFEAEPWAKNAVRLAIAMGSDADLDVLRRFIGNPEIAPLEAKNGHELGHFLRWASTMVAQGSARGTAGMADIGDAPVVVGDPPPGRGLDDTW